jgi:hypothetical protein
VTYSSLDSRWIGSLELPPSSVLIFGASSPKISSLAFFDGDISGSESSFAGVGTIFSGSLRFPPLFLLAAGLLGLELLALELAAVPVVDVRLIF